MKPPFAYYGGKTTMAAKLAALLPQHKIYVEPFAGSLALLFAKRRVEHEIVSDASGHLVTFFRVLRDDPAALEQACRLTPWSREEFLGADPDEPGIADVERARRWWVRVTQSHSNAYGNTWVYPVTRNGSRAGERASALGRFDALSRRLASVAIENRPAVDVITKYGMGNDTVVYADPPYVPSSRTKPGQGYEHDMVEDDHRALAEVLRATPATVLLSGYPSDLYDELFGDWHQMATTVTKRSSSNRREPGADSATEVIWSNRPLGGQGSLLEGLEVAR